MKTSKIIATIMLVPLALLISIPFFATAMSTELYSSLMTFVAYGVMASAVTGIVYLYRN